MLTPCSGQRSLVGRGPLHLQSSLDVLCRALITRSTPADQHSKPNGQKHDCSNAWQQSKPEGWQHGRCMAAEQGKMGKSMAAEQQNMPGPPDPAARPNIHQMSAPWAAPDGAPIGLCCAQHLAIPITDLHLRLIKQPLHGAAADVLAPHSHNLAACTAMLSTPCWVCTQNTGPLPRRCRVPWHQKGIGSTAPLSGRHWGHIAQPAQSCLLC